MGSSPHYGGDFEVVFGPLYRQARGVAYALLGDPVSAEDAAAEALARAFASWRRVGRLPYRDAWVMRVTVNVAVDALRRRPFVAATPAAVPDPGDAIVLGMELKDALLKLPKRQREVVVLRWLGGFTEVEVSRCLGLSLSSVKTHSSRGIAALRLHYPGGLDHVAP